MDRATFADRKKKNQLNWRARVPAPLGRHGRGSWRGVFAQNRQRRKRAGARIGAGQAVSETTRLVRFNSQNWQWLPVGRCSAKVVCDLRNSAFVPAARLATQEVRQLSGSGSVLENFQYSPLWSEVAVYNDVISDDDTSFLYRWTRSSWIVRESVFFFNFHSI